MRSVTPSVRAALVGIAFCLCVATSAIAVDRPDSWITAKTKLALMTTEGVDTWDLNVDTVNGMVTLHGKVASEAAKQKAETVAQGIEGAKTVKNLLQVVPKPQRDMVEEKDEVITDHLKKAFEADPVVDGSGISVASVNKGVVLLSGTAKSIDAAVKAVEVARQVPGVRRVASEVKVEGTH
jgi:hyperosmotically inducible protein